MRSLAISRDRPLLTSLRMVGIQGIYCKDERELEREFAKASKDQAYGLIILGEEDFIPIKEEVYQVKMKNQGPLVTVVPGPKGYKEENFVIGAIQEAMGLSMD